MDFPDQQIAAMGLGIDLKKDKFFIKYGVNFLHFL
jgi:hypothetical protein